MRFGEPAYPRTHEQRMNSCSVTWKTNTATLRVRCYLRRARTPYQAPEHLIHPTAWEVSPHTIPRFLSVAHLIPGGAGGKGSTTSLIRPSRTFPSKSRTFPSKGRTFPSKVGLFLQKVGLFDQESDVRVGRPSRTSDWSRTSDSG
jgi:hypothetical protein